MDTITLRYGGVGCTGSGLHRPRSGSGRSTSIRVVQPAVGMWRNYCTDRLTGSPQAQQLVGMVERNRPAAMRRASLIVR